jgi:hypothetical protein
MNYSAMGRGHFKVKLLHGFKFNPLGLKGWNDNVAIFTQQYIVPTGTYFHANYMINVVNVFN